MFYPTAMLWGPVSIRHLLSIITLVLCFAVGKVKLDRFLKWYFVFIFFYTIIEVATGFSIVVFSKLVGTYFASIALYFATKIMVEKYEKGSIIIYILVALGIINAIEVIAQYFGSPIAVAIPEILHIQMDEEYMDVLFKSVPPLNNIAGLMGVVRSGYFLSATAVMALYYEREKISIFNWIAVAIILFALFLVQERSGLIFGLICASFYLISYSIKNKKTLFATAIVIIVAVILLSNYVLTFVSIEDMRYATKGMDDTRRITLARNAIAWFFSHPMGGASQYFAMGGGYPHNFFVNALLYGGIFGGSVLIGILFVQLYRIWKIISSYLRIESISSLLLVCCFAYLCYTFNSFFHNFSLVTGGEMIFLLWAMIGSLYNSEIRNLNSRENQLDK